MREIHHKVYINKTNYLITMSIIALFPLEGLGTLNPVINVIYDIGGLCMFVFFALCLVREKISLEIFFPFAISIYLIVNTIIQKGDMVQVGACLGRDLGIYFTTIYWIHKGKSRQLIMNSSRVFDFFLIINAVHMLLTENGFGFTRSGNKIFILTSDNGLLYYIIVFVVVHELRNKIHPVRTVRNVIYYFMILYELIRGQAATSYFVMIVMLIGLLFAREIAVNHYLNIGYVVIAFFNIFLLFIRNLFFMQSIFESIGKDITLSGRVFIWDNALSMIGKRCLFGYGIIDDMAYVMFAGKYIGTHNMILCWLLQGGIILLGLVLYMIWLYGHKVKISNSVVSRYIAIGILAILLYFSVEAPLFNTSLYFILALCQMVDSKHNLICQPKYE